MSLDMQKLFDLAKDGKDAQEIMDTMGIKSKGRLEQLLYRLSKERGEILDVPGLSEQDNSIRTLKENGISIPPSLLEGKYPAGSEFKFEGYDDKIVLNLIR